MAQRIALLLGFFIFTSPILVQEKEKTPAPAKFKVKTLQWTARNAELAIESEAGEKYISHLGLLPYPGPAMEKIGAGNERRLLLFPYDYEAVLQQRFISMLSHEIAFSTNKYDGSQGQKEDRPKRLETFFWDASRDILSVEFTPGIFKNGAILPLNEKLKYSFDLKSNRISEGFLFPQFDLDENDAEMIKNFLAFLAVYVRESVEWYEVEMKKRKAPQPPEKKKNDIAVRQFPTPPRISGVFLLICRKLKAPAVGGGF
jgi:hypothetical protein